jgi:uncharacterized protein YjbJ (UPF0337 family)
MNEDQVKGTIDELVGSAKHKAGDLTGDVHLQVEGMAQQAKGKIENAWGKAKDAVQEANQKTTVRHDPHV